MPVLGVSRLKVSAIRDEVAQALRHALLEGRFKPGESLSEPAIAAELQISRGPVREAMLVLVAEGLLTHVQNRGFSVLSFSATDLEQIEEARLPLETLALSVSRDRVTADDLRKLEATRDELSQTFGAGDLQGSLCAEIAFHSLIWELSGNPWLVASLKRIMVPSFTYGAAFRMSRPDLSPRILEDLHNLYISFLKGTSPHTAEECVRLHIASPEPAA
jgi:DNA-binding GntR family transcriptional regulator